MIDNSVYATVLSLLSAALNGEACPDFDLSLWPDVKKEMKSQGILVLARDTILQSRIPAEEKQDIMRLSALNTSVFFRIMAQQNETLQLLSENAVPAAVLKGSSCACCYDKPWLRKFGDIDLIVLPEDFEKTRILFCENGYTQLDETDGLYQRHIAFLTPSGFEIELHRYFSCSFNEDQNMLLDRWIFDAIPHVRQVQLKHYSFPALPPLENGLVILAHVNQHLGTGLGLRPVTDWMMYVKSQLSDVFWEEYFREKAEAVGLADLAKTLTRMCQLYLGLTEDIGWCRDADEELAEELVLYTIEKGDHGAKIQNGAGRTVSIAHRLLNPAKAFAYLTEAGMINMQQAGLRPVKAFAWVYQIMHLLCMTVKRKDKKNFFRELRQGAKEKDFLERLKVTRM